MKVQNFKNHARWIIGYHVISFFAIIALLIGSIINIFNSSDENLYSASLLVLVSIILFIIFFYLRSFALKSQDRAIRAEEKLRYFILTGKPLSNEVNTRQIIGLRFASDEEFPELVNKAIQEKLTEVEIKSLIKNWKPDFYRV